MKTKRLIHHVILIFILIVSISCKERKQVAVEKPNTEPLNEITQEEIDQITDKWLDLWATYDLDDLEDIFLQSKDLTYFSSETQGLIKGYAAIKPHHEAFGFIEGGKKPEKSLWLENLESRIHDGSAVLTAIWYFGDKTAPKDSVQNGPVTFVMTYGDGGLKIAHVHFANY